MAWPTSAADPDGGRSAQAVGSPPNGSEGRIAYRRCPKCWQKHGLSEATCLNCGTDLAGAELFDVAPVDLPRLVITERAIGAVTILDLAKVLMEDRGVHELGDRIRVLLDQGRRQILVNLSGLVYCDSTGLEELLGAHTTVARHGGTMKLVNTSKRIPSFPLTMIAKLPPFATETAGLSAGRRR